MQGTTHHPEHAQDTQIRRLPAMWRWWGLGLIILALYILCLVLHWTKTIDRVPAGISVLAHLSVVVLFMGGCVTLLREELRNLTVAQALADASGIQAEPVAVPRLPPYDTDIRSQVADLQRWRRVVDSPNVTDLEMIRRIKAVDDRLHPGPDR